MTLRERITHHEILTGRKLNPKPSLPDVPNDYKDYPDELKRILTSLARISDSIQSISDRDTDTQFGMILDAIEQIPKDLAAVL